jgi:magnesium transporter
MRERTLAGRPEGPGFHWLDIESPTEERLQELLREYGIVAPIHAAEPRLLRPTMLEGENHLGVILVGPGEGEGALAEVRCFVGPDWMLTVHEACPELPCSERAEEGPAEALDVLAHSLVTGLVEMVRRLGDQVAAVEDAVRPDTRRAATRRVTRRLQALRHVLLPQRDVLTRLGAGEGPAPRGSAAARGLRNSAERMAQVGVEAETLREALRDANADRQNDIVRRLTAIAAVFLPLTFMTGFFGQNFGWMVGHIDSPAAFVGFGVVLPVAAVASLLYAFHRSGWL